MGTSAQIAFISLQVASTREQRIAAKQQRKSSKKAQQAADIRASRERRQVVREGRIRRAQILQTAANTGAAGSSSELGAIGGIQTQIGAELGTSLQIQGLSQQQSRANRAATSAQSRAASFQAAASAASVFAPTTSIFK